MTDPATADARDVRERDQEERTKVAFVWGLYLVALFTGVTLIVGAVLALLFRGDAPAWARTHYDQQVKLAWVGALWVVLATVLIGVGVPLSFVLIGIPILLLGLAIAALSWLWVLLRSVQGLARVGDRRPF